MPTATADPTVVSKAFDLLRGEQQAEAEHHRSGNTLYYEIILRLARGEEQPRDAHELAALAVDRQLTEEQVRQDVDNARTFLKLRERASKIDSLRAAEREAARQLEELRQRHAQELREAEIAYGQAASELRAADAAADRLVRLRQAEPWLDGVECQVAVTAAEVAAVREAYRGALRAFATQPGEAAFAEVSRVGKLLQLSQSDGTKQPAGRDIGEDATFAAQCQQLARELAEAKAAHDAFSKEHGDGPYRDEKLIGEHRDLSATLASAMSKHDRLRRELSKHPRADLFAGLLDVVLEPATER